MQGLPWNGVHAGVRADGVYVLASEGIFKLPLDLRSGPELVLAVNGGNGSFLVSDRIWFASNDEFCSIEPIAPEEVSCVDSYGSGGEAFAARGDEFFFHVLGIVGEVRRINLSGSASLLYRPLSGPYSGLSGPPVLADNYLYGFGYTGTATPELLQFPADHAETPQPVISAKVAQALFDAQPNADGAGAHLTVNSTGVFWAQRFVEDESATGNDLSRYIFRAPLADE
jgi:hypothetical protein